MAHRATTATVADRVLARLRTRLLGGGGAHRRRDRHGVAASVDGAIAMVAGVGIALVWELSR